MDYANQANAGSDAYIRNLAQTQTASVLGAPVAQLSAENILQRLRMSAARMAEYNGKIGESLDRLVGGQPENPNKNAAVPMPADFIGNVNSILDDIGRELSRMENNGMRLARVI